MRPLMSLILAVAASAPVPAMLAVQAAPPQQPPSSGPVDCFQLKFAEIIGVDHSWARIHVGDEWISGCLGPAGKCFAPIWIRCDE
jgi:hypothetical protein